MDTAALLGDIGHTVLEAETVDEALVLFRAHPEIDLIVTDYAMPGKAGVDLAEQASAERPGMPIVLATGYGEMPSGPNLSIQRLGKPFGHSELRLAISTATTAQPD